MQLYDFFLISIPIRALAKPVSAAGNLYFHMKLLHMIATLELEVNKRADD